MKIIKAFGYDVVWMKYLPDIDGFISSELFPGHALFTYIINRGSHLLYRIDRMDQDRPMLLDKSEHMKQQIDRGAVYVSLLSDGTVLIHGDDVIAHIISIVAPSKATIVSDELYEFVKEICADFCDGKLLEFALHRDVAPTKFDNKYFLEAAINAQKDVPNDTPSGWIKSTERWLWTKVTQETLDEHTVTVP